uniref:Vomeronasal 2, receptor 118 n=1 Tax=Jaculus jaculus TaxID=51337 RepID=A0A8C5K7N4_JACJA
MPIKIYEFVLAMLFAIEEINRNPDLLPNVTLSFTLFGAHCDSTTTEVNSLNLFSKYELINPNYICAMSSCDVILTGPSWTASTKIGTLLWLFNYPQPKTSITYGPFHPILSDYDRFPHLYQMAPRDTYLPLAMVSLLLHFKWTWVGLVITDDDQGVQFFSNLRQEMHRNEICLAFVNVIPVNMQVYIMRAETYYNQIVTSSAKVVIIYGEKNSTLEVSFRRWECLGTQRIWVTTSKWNTLTRKRDFNLDLYLNTFIFSHHHHEISSFKNFIQTVNFSTYPNGITLKQLSWMYFNCSTSISYCKTMNNCSSNTILEWLLQHSFDMSMNDDCYNIYNAAYAVAHAFHEKLIQQVDIRGMEKQTHLMHECSQLHAIMKSIQFTNPIGDPVNMNQREKIDAMYDILNFWNFPQSLRIKVKIGEFSPYFTHDQQLYVSKEMIEWATGNRQIPISVCSMTCSPGFRKSHQEGRAACCFDCSPCPVNEISNATGMDQCVKCPDEQYANKEHNCCLPKAVTFLAYEDSLGMSLACMALGFSALTTLVLGIFLKHQDTPIVKANNRTLSYILLISLLFCFLCSLLFIGHPNLVTCILQQTTFVVLFTMAVSTVLAKTITVLLAFKITAPGKRMRWMLVSGTLNFIIPICTLIQLFFCGIWLGTSPPFVDTDAYSEHGHIIIMCNKGSVTVFYCVLGYITSLALVSFTVAFLARKLPDTFNEAKFLTFSMLVFCSVWVTFLLVYQSTRGKFMVAVEVFSILASSAGLLGCIFVPKCYIILFRPSVNSLQMFKNK